MSARIYSVYAAHGPDGHVYVGCTGGSMRTRWLYHVSRAARGGTSAFHVALRTHGEAAFEVEIVFQTREADAAGGFERALISHFFIRGIAELYNQLSPRRGCDSFYKAIRYSRLGLPVELRNPRRKQGFLLPALHASSAAGASA